MNVASTDISSNNDALGMEPMYQAATMAPSQAIQPWHNQFNNKI